MWKIDIFYVFPVNLNNTDFTMRNFYWNNADSFSMTFVNRISLLVII